MKKNILYLFICIGFIVFNSCKCETMLNVSLSVLNFNYLGGESYFMLVVNKDWSVDIPKDWCKLSRSGGNSAGMTCLSVEENKEGEERCCKIRFISFEKECVLEVYQAGNK